MGVSQSNETLMETERRDDGVYYYARFDNEPFSSGACRFAYKGELLCNEKKRHKAKYNGLPIVVKVFKREYAKDYGAWNSDISASKKANEYAILFNEKKFIDRVLSFPTPHVAKMETRAGFSFFGLTGYEYDLKTNPVGSSEYVAMEEYLTGKYIKFNSNNGYVNNAVNSSTMPAFSHWTFHQSDGQVLVCDLQGVLNDGNYRLTDPAIHSRVANTYGSTDLGVFGQARFFQTHQCNDICRGWKKLHLTDEIQTELSKVPTSVQTLFGIQVASDVRTSENQFSSLFMIEE